MRTIDFSRSFFTFRIDTLRKPPATVSHQPPYSLNNARIQLECRCRVVENRTRFGQTFYLGAACKTERVGVSRNIWTEPNADFTPIFSADRFLYLKTYAKVGVDVDLYPPGSGRQSDRQTGFIADALDDFRVNVVLHDARVLSSPQEIVDATLANHPLTARTILRSPQYTAVVEYPVKTMNANERDVIYQTDTGPILLPDLEASPDELLTSMELAFAAFNAPNWIELLVRTPTSLNEDVAVYHYSKAVRYEAINEVLCHSAESMEIA